MVACVGFGCVYRLLCVDYVDMRILDETLEDIFCRASFPHGLVKIVLLDDFPERRSAHDLLLDGFNPLVGVRGDRRPY